MRSAPTPTFMQLEAGETIVEFTWHRDRWQHEIRTRQGDRWLSIETDDDGAAPGWPESPVLTEVSLQEVAGKPVLLGVGLAGRSHFSLCVTAHPDKDDTLLFETACRFNAPAERLGSSYRCKDGRTVRVEVRAPFELPPATACWNYTAGPEGLHAVPPAGARAAAG